VLSLENFFINENNLSFINYFFFGTLILDHDNKGVMYNPLFHEEGGNSINSIAMPCGLGGSENHSH
jgi:hypothetical protein